MLFVVRVVVAVVVVMGDVVVVLIVVGRLWLPYPHLPLYPGYLLPDGPGWGCNE